MVNSAQSEFPFRSSILVCEKDCHRRLMLQLKFSYERFSFQFIAWRCISILVSLCWGEKKENSEQEDDEQGEEMGKVIVLVVLHENCTTNHEI